MSQAPEDVVICECDRCGESYPKFRHWGYTWCAPCLTTAAQRAMEEAVAAVPEAHRRLIADWIRGYVEPGASPEGDEKSSIRRRLGEHLAWKLDGRRGGGS